MTESVIIGFDFGEKRSLYVDFLGTRIFDGGFHVFYVLNLYLSQNSLFDCGCINCHGQ